jgi:uncharacterized protein YecT (DUF1311 family)/sugar lactone lactonase YvrE
MKKLFVAVTIVGLATMLVSVSAHARNLAFDDKGNLFVSDEDNHSILKFTPEGKKSTFASGLGNPVHLTFDDKGNLFVADDDNHSILKFTFEGKKSTFASGLEEYLGHPTFDDKGNLFVRDWDSHSIFKFTPEGVKSTFASGLNEPFDLAFDRSGDLFVTDFVAEDGSYSILKFTPDGKKSAFDTGIKPYGMALDAAGNLFVLEYGSDLIFKFTPDGTRSTFVSDRVSPDKQWEYQCSADRENPRIVKAGTSQTVLDLSEKVPQWGNEAKIVWASDSKRFALNYTEGGRARSSPTALYQLRGDKWLALRSPETDEMTEPLERAQLAQFSKMHPGHKLWYTKKVLKWTDGSTALLYSGLGVMGNDDGYWPETGFLFTLKFDAKGNWKIVKSHQMSDKEVEKEDAGEDVPGPAKTTDQEKLSADAGFRDADRHLNEVYNALRARLSRSERDGLKKEQLAWINRRNAAAQAAKANAQENPTDVADGEVTKMTLARAAELEKRLEKAK